MPILYHPDAAPLRSVSGVELAQGVGVQEAKGFWADAWSRVVRRGGAIFGLSWLGVVAFFAVFAPLLANGHPLILRTLDAGGLVTSTSYPILKFLRPSDVLLVVGLFGGALWMALPAASVGRAGRVLILGAGVVLLGIVAVAVASPLAHSFADPARGASFVFSLSLAGAGVAALGWCILAVATPRSDRGASLFIAVLQCGLIVWGCVQFQNATARPVSDLSAWMASLKDRPWIAYEAAPVIALIFTGLTALVPVVENRWRQVAMLAAVGVVSAASVSATWDHPLQNFDYREREAMGTARCTWTLIPFSPTQASTRLYVKRPGATVYEPVFDRIEDSLRARAGGSASPRTTSVLETVTVGPNDISIVDSAIATEGVGVADAKTIRDAAAEALGQPGATAAGLLESLRGLPFHRFLLGSDPLGQDVLSQLLHACRLSISIGLVSTGIAVVIGVTIGALMGYFGGWVDLLLYRVVEIFMAIPVLFLLIVAAAVLKRDTYVMMAIIGCVTWTGAARFTRAEFFKLRNQDFVQSARAVGLPLRSILFKHMLPNGVTPVLVDSSFAIAAAILAEAVLSYLGLGPDGQASWGKLLSSATGTTGTFVWWLAIFPGFAIFLTVLAYNLIGEAMRDAIDPKLKKARV